MRQRIVNKNRTNERKKENKKQNRWIKKKKITRRIRATRSSEQTYRHRLSVVCLCMRARRRKRDKTTFIALTNNKRLVSQKRTHTKRSSIVVETRSLLLPTRHSMVYASAIFSILTHSRNSCYFEWRWRRQRNDHKENRDKSIRRTLAKVNFASMCVWVNIK